MAFAIPEVLGAVGGGEAAGGAAASGGASGGMLGRLGSFMGGAKGPASSGGKDAATQKVPEVVTNAAAITASRGVLGGIH